MDGMQCDGHPLFYLPWSRLTFLFGPVTSACVHQVPVNTNIYTVAEESSQRLVERAGAVEKIVEEVKESIFVK